MNHAEILRSVSRSFYLSMRFLPAGMREPVSLGYLLARVSDTLADTVTVPLDRRMESLRFFEEAIGKESDLRFDPAPFREALDHEGEKELLENTNDILNWYRSLDSRNQQLVGEVLTTIIEGQKWDLAHFHQSAGTCPSAEELLGYTYRVAGCVGEFWTKVGFENLGRKFAEPQDREALLTSGRHLGQGLQLINILRDLHEDLPRGRCYLPSDELKDRGWDGTSRPQPEQVGPVFLHWLQRCRDLLQSGRDYLPMVKNRRVRFCSKLPLILAELTADKLEEAGVEQVMARKIRITRREVRRAMMRSWWGKR